MTGSSPQRGPSRPHTLVAGIILAVCVLLTAAAVVLILLARPYESVPAGTRNGLADVGAEIALLGFAVLGALVAWRRPDNRIGWVYLALGVGWAVYVFTDAWAVYAIYAKPGSLPGGTALGWVNSWLTAAVVFLTMIWPLHLFPNGRFLTPRWRWPAWIATAATVVSTLALAFDPGPLSGYEAVDNPLGSSTVHSVLLIPDTLSLVTLPVGVLLAAAVPILRLRRAHGIERLQMKWFIWAAAFVGLALIAAIVVSQVLDWTVVAGAIAVSSFLGIIIASGIAILRHQLIDIDIVINRTLVYGVLSVLLGVAYSVGVILMQGALSGIASGSDLAVAGTTLLVAALARPGRARVQRVVDRRFYRHKYDAQRTIDAFSNRLREELDLDALVTEVRTVVHETMQPEHVSVWLRPR